MRFHLAAIASLVVAGTSQAAVLENDLLHAEFGGEAMIRVRGGPGKETS